jgi:hypothetical protein
MEQDNGIDVNDIDVSVMIDIKLKLENCPVVKQNADYKNICSHVKKYLLKYCKHNIIEDLIDIDYDTSKQITYCDYCETCFR